MSKVCCSAAAAASPPADFAPTARRRKLWDLPVKHHCLLLGAAFDPRELRQMFRRAGSENWRKATDYELHSSAVHFAQSRNDFSELAQRRIEERFRAGVTALRAAAGPGDLLAQSRGWAGRGNAVEAYWAALTHPECDGETEEALASEIHMVAHDLFAERRATARRIRAFEAQIDGLQSAAAAAQQRIGALKRETAARRDEALTVRRDLAAALDECERWRAGTETEERDRRVAGLQAALDAARSETEAVQRALRRAERRLERSTTGETPAPAKPIEPVTCVQASAMPLPAPPPDLGNARILCVGGKKNLVPMYRTTVETAHGEFAHHDGGIEDQVSRLPALLGRADAVVCLAGDCGHPAYYAVKRYCKRFGKPCALLGNSSVHALTQCISKGFPRAA